MSCSPHVRRGGNLSLSSYAAEKSFPPLRRLIVGLGWNPNRQEGVDFDLDASALGLTANGRLLSEEHFVFFNNLVSPDGAIRHMGDNLTGEGEGDDEELAIALDDLPVQIRRVLFVVSIYDAGFRGQTFGQVANAYIRVRDENANVLTRYDLTTDATNETAMVFGELYRPQSLWRGTTEWKFRAIGQGYSNGLEGIASDYGATVK